MRRESQSVLAEGRRKNTLTAVKEGDNFAKQVGAGISFTPSNS